MACNNRNKEWCPFGTIGCECDAYIPHELEEDKSIDFTCTDKNDNEQYCIYEGVKDDDSITNRVFVPIVKTVQRIFPQYLVKDLKKDERICPVCHGLGVRIVENIYGIVGDTSEAARKEMFPYKKQSLSLCRSCYNGVQKVCEFCGKPFKQPGYQQCDCEGFKKAEEDEKIKWRKLRVTMAKEITESDVDTILYCEEYDTYYHTVEDFFDDYVNKQAGDQGSLKPKVLWVCEEWHIYVDANDILDIACTGLREGALESCDIKSLQKLLNEWCKEQIGTTTYHPFYKEYVKIDWSRYECK